MDYELLFLKALAVTVSVETLVLLLLARLAFRRLLPDLSISRLIFAGILCSAATLPYLWFIFPRFIHDRTLMIIIGELSVVLAEAGLYLLILGVDWKKAFILSAFCNAASMAAGLLFF